MSKAFVMLTASRVEAGPVQLVAGALQQETRLFEGDQAVCVLLVTFPPGSPEWERWHAARTLDGAPAGMPGAAAPAQPALDDSLDTSEADAR